MKSVLDRLGPIHRLRSMTPITPLKAPALADLKNALQLASVYGDKDVADSDAKQALDRIRGLIAQALAKLGEPNNAAVEAAVLMFAELPPFGDETFPRKARDAAAVILHAALTGENLASALSVWDDGLPCPGCDGAGRIGSIPCDQCKGAGKL